jgi:hypothetical protein
VGIVLALVMAGVPLHAHPHPGDVVTDTFRGRVTEINLERKTIAIDAMDRKTKEIRNYLFFFDPKVKVTRAKKKVPIAELMPGQVVVCVVEVEMNERGEPTRYIAFDVRFDLQARPAARQVTGG